MSLFICLESICILCDKLDLSSVDQIHRLAELIIGVDEIALPETDLAQVAHHAPDALTSLEILEEFKLLNKLAILVEEDFLFESRWKLCNERFFVYTREQLCEIVFQEMSNLCIKLLFQPSFSCKLLECSLFELQGFVFIAKLGDD